MKIKQIITQNFGTNVYLFETDKSVVVVDPGENAAAVLDLAKTFNKPLKYVLLTHAHYDHVGAVTELQEQVGAKVYMHKNELDNIIKGGYVFGKIGADVLLNTEDSIQLDNLKIDILHTPGHSTGCVCYIVGDTMFCGDTLFLEEIGRCDLYSGDFDVIKSTLKKLFDMHRVDGIDYKILPGHGDPTTLSHEAKYNPYA